MIGRLTSTSRPEYLANLADRFDYTSNGKLSKVINVSPQRSEYSYYHGRRILVRPQIMIADQDELLQLSFQGELLETANWFNFR